RARRRVRLSRRRSAASRTCVRHATANTCSCQDRLGDHAAKPLVQADRPAAKSGASAAYASLGVETPGPPVVRSPLCQPPPILVPSFAFPFRVDSSTSRNHSTSVTVGSHAKYLWTVWRMSSACACSATTATFSLLKYWRYEVVFVCHPSSSIRNVSPFSVVGWPVPLNAS